MASKCAIVQMNCVDGDIDKNTESLLDMIQRIHQEEKNVQMIIFPEMILYGYEKFEEIILKYSQEDIEEKLTLLAEQCSTCSVDIVVGTPKIEGNVVKNALYYIGQNRVIKHVYSKVHMIKEEQSFIQASDYFAICETVLGKTGFLICWDSAFAEASRVYKKYGADVLVVCAAWEKMYQWQWKVAVAARSLDNSIPILASNRRGSNNSAEFAGHAMATDCMGNVIGELDEKTDGYLTVDIDSLHDEAMLDSFGSPFRELRNELYDLNKVKEIG